MEKISIINVAQKKAQSQEICKPLPKNESKQTFSVNIIEPPPDRVVAQYNTELNIFKIHEAIELRLNHKIHQLPEIENSLKLEHHKKRSQLTINEARTINKKITDFNNQIELIKSGKEIIEYNESVKTLLTLYSNVSTSISDDIVSITGLVTKKKEETPEIISERLHIIDEYLKIAKKYIDIQITHVEYIEPVCPVCNDPIENCEVDDEQQGLIVCKCGYQKESITLESYYKDSSRVNLGNRNNYEDGENFHKVLMRYQGKEQQTPPDKLYDQLDEYFSKIEFKLGSDIRKEPVNSKGKKEGTSMKLMESALSSTFNSAFYDNIWLIMHIYWGWTLNDITHLETKIMDDYKSTQIILNAMPVSKKGREASLNTQLRLYWHLKAVDWPCSKEDFRIPTSRDSLVLQEELMFQMCAATGVPFHSVL